MVVRELVTKLGFKTNKAGLASYTASIKKVAAVAALASAAIAGIGFALIKVTKDTANFGDDLAKTSQKLGISVEQLQKLKYAGDLAGVSFGGMQNGLKRLSRNIVDANDGLSTAVDAFKRIKLDPKNIKSTEDGLMKIADAFAVMENGTVKSAVAQELFGRAGLDLIPLLNEGSAGIKKYGKELEELGFILDTKTAKASEEFNDNMLRIETVIEGIKFQLGTELLPIMSDFVKRMLEWVKANKDLLRQKVKQYLETFINLVKFLYKVVDLGVSIFNKFAKVVGGTANAFKILTSAVIIAGLLKIFAMMTAILGLPVAAAVVSIGGLALAIEDVATAFQGGESASVKFWARVIGGSEEAAAEIEANHRTLFGAAYAIGGWSATWVLLKSIASDAITALGDWIQSIMKASAEKTKDLFISALKAIRAVFVGSIETSIKAISTLVTDIGNMFTNSWLNTLDKIKMKIDEIKSSLLGTAIDFVINRATGGGASEPAGAPQASMLGGGSNSLAGLGFSGTPSTSSNSNVNNNMQNSFNIKVDVNDKSGVGKDVAQEIKVAITNELGNQFRRAMRNTQTATV